MRGNWTLALLAALTATAIAAPPATPEPAADELRAFTRPARAGDALPVSLRYFGRFVDSRRIATYRDRRGRSATLYVVKRRERGRLRICTVLVQWNGAGGGCSAPANLFRWGHRVSASAGRLFAGVAANEVTRVVLVGSRGVRHPVRLTPDGGFIDDCRAYNGCPCVIAWLDAYDRAGRRVTHEWWLSSSCRTRR